MENWIIFWEGIASTKLFMVATLVSKLPFMYYKRNSLYYFAHDCSALGSSCGKETCKDTLVVSILYTY